MRTQATLFVAVAALVGASWFSTSCGGDDTTGGTGGSTGTGGVVGTGGAGGTEAGATGGAGGVDASMGTGGGTGGVDASMGTGGNRDAAVDVRDAAAADGDAAGNPPAPTLGAQIDRLGRPAINTALTDPFDTLGATTTPQAKDAYNAASDPTMWKTMFAAEIAGNLAILDGLDGVCGNQAAAGPTADAGAGAMGRYGALAGVLADDRLYVNTTKSDAGTVTCSGYLAVEVNATGLAPNTDCGGRKLDFDVVDISYSVLAAGSLASPPPVTDGVANDNTFSATFPFLAGPN